ncbi:beta-lactamase regulating signal transducer with metallopeptidase domain [Ruminiclostridium sufflavum DSM 19573]|uniref:Beta-lactamase regulating signal transducer with metallopeptidase domain n=1 Tax=Ruminiclostridium sufflavum DSM 19573 TaxID=1121337 RepID=A0A318XQL2_9FIRM|nr:M56 family metallopeptidase [Ruminiclostridium sufflavum]PYG90395.1 beta-lactamase regulating signal transducer with metallopeptidase domain [Ruminiclostridium sufflavum DSM 19573]
MEKLFFSILNMSITASYVIIFVILVRLLLRKAPKVISYALWSVVAFRLICPFSFESLFSLLPASTAPIPQNLAYEQNPRISSGIAAIDTYVNSSLLSPSPAASANPLQIYAQIGSAIWLSGIAAILLYSIVSVLVLKRQLKGAKHIERNIYEAGSLKTPFVLGILSPRIYIPSGLTAEEKSHIIRHEQAHIRRFDYIVKPFAFFVLSIHWFNPLAWLAFILMSSDMELSCDEKVIQEMGIEIKKAYSASLLSLASGKHIINGSPLAFGEGNVRIRIKNVLNYKKPAFWLVIVAAVTVTAVGIGLAVNPKASAAGEKDYAKEIYQYRTQYVGDNSKVAGIADKLTVPDTLTRTQIRLLTDNPPYGVEITYNTTSEAREAFSDADSQSAFDKNAILMFALIKNTDYVNFILTDGKNELPIYRTRTWANSNAGTDVWESSATFESFTSLYSEINNRFSNEYKKQKQPVNLFNLVIAENTVTLSNGKIVSVRLVMTDGEYFDEEYAGAGGGTYPENYQGSYEIQILNSDGKLISKKNFENEGQPANFAGRFNLLFDDYNNDKNPDFSIGQWGSSSMNIYWLYTIMPDGTVKNIISEAFAHSSHAFSVKFDKDKASGFYAQFYNNAIGETLTTHYVWDKSKNSFYKNTP